LHNRLKKPSFLDVCVSSYIGHFYQADYSMSYINLCMSLESLIHESTEITYRISRMCAVLNAGEHHYGVVIYKNMKKCYGLRSKIVHGANYIPQRLLDYKPFLQSLVSRTIIEIVSMKFENKEILNDTITEFGFGDRDILVQNYQEFPLNLNAAKELRLSRHLPAIDSKAVAKAVS
jgi:hypothetical protein